MKRIWYVHKWQHGVYKGCNRVPGSFDDADRHAANLGRKYTGYGWVYEVSASAEEPAPTFAEAGAGI